MTDRTPITEPTNKAYRKAARKLYGRDGEIEIDLNAKISRGCDPGAYVQAWVWVDDRDLEPEAGPSYDVWIAEQEDLGPAPGGCALGEWQWRFDQRFTCEDDPDGKGARRSAHEHARHLRNTYPCLLAAVRPAGSKPTLIPRWQP